MSTFLRAFVVVTLVASSLPAAPPTPGDDSVHRSPVDVAVSADQRWVATANQTANTVTLISWPDGKLQCETPVGDRPTYILSRETPEGTQFLVSCTFAQQVLELRVEQGENGQPATLAPGRTFELPGQPVGLALNATRGQLYVALESEAAVAEVDLASGKVTRTIETGRWPRFLALSRDGSRLGVSTSGDRGVSVIDLASGKTVHQQSFIGLNIGHLQLGADDRVYFPWMVYRRNPISAGNIRLGWVLASRLGRFRLDSDERREAVSLDPPGRAIADPYGLAITAKGDRLVSSASGTHELLVYRLDALPFESAGGPDHLEPELREAPEKFDRIELGGRPMGLRMLSDDNTVLVSNYLSDALQVVDVAERRVTRTLSLGGPRQPSLEREGEAIFYDGQRSLDQWYSCHSCHQDGAGNSVVIDTFNDATPRTYKSVLPLYHVTETAPWTWHGWQTDLRAAMNKSITSTMLGKPPTEHEVDALIAYLRTLKPPPKVERPETEASRRGEAIFAEVGCADCHRGPHFTDGKVHDVGLGRPGDRYEGFNTPSLHRVSRKVKLLHDGRADSLRAVLEGAHNPADVTGKKLDERQLDDLLEFLNRL